MVSPPDRIGRYQLLHELGRGGMGVVWEARDPALPGRRLALKLLHADLADAETILRFLREAELVARVRHPGVIPIHAVEQGPTGPYLVTDLIEGRPLAGVVAGGGLAPRPSAELVIDLCEAAAALHAAGIVHRDLKPENVMIRPDGAPVLLDFGIARELDRDSLTRTGELLGTPAYMAPEQVRDPRRVDARADVYALGGVLYALLRGRAPFQGGVLQVLEAALGRGPDWPACADPGLDAICRRAMALEPDARFESATELARALRGWAQGAVGSRSLPRAVAIAAAAFALGGVIALVWRRGGPEVALPPPSAPVASSAVEPARPESAGERLLRELELAPPEQARDRWRALRQAVTNLPAGDPLRRRLSAEGPRLLCATRGLRGLCAAVHLTGDRLLLRDERGVWGWTPGAHEPEPLRTLARGGDSQLLPPLLLREEQGQVIVIEGPGVIGLALPDLKTAWGWTGDGPARVLTWSSSGTVLLASNSALSEISLPASGEPEVAPRGDWDGVVTALIPEPGSHRLWMLQRPTGRHPCVTVRELDLERVWFEPGVERELRPEPLCGAFAGGLLLGRVDGSVTREGVTWRFAGGGEVKGLRPARRAPVVWVAATHEHQLRLGRIDLRSPGGPIPSWDVSLEIGRSPALGLSLSPDEDELAVSGEGWAALFGLPPTDQRE